MHNVFKNSHTFAIYNKSSIKMLLYSVYVTFLQLGL